MYASAPLPSLFSFAVDEMYGKGGGAEKRSLRPTGPPHPSGTTVALRLTPAQSGGAAAASDADAHLARAERALQLESFMRAPGCRAATYGATRSLRRPSFCPAPPATSHPAPASPPHARPFPPLTRLLPRFVFAWGPSPPAPPPQDPRREGRGGP